MDRAGLRLYILAIGSPIETRLFFSDDAACPIGRVRMAGTIAASPGTRDRRFPDYAIVYVVGGAGRFRDELGHDQAITPGDAIVVFPQIAHSYGPEPGGDWSELYVVFDGPVFDLWRERGLLDPARPVHRLEPVDDWLAQLRSFVQHPRPRSPHERESEVCRFLLLLTSMLGRSGRAATWVERSQSLLASGLDEPLALEVVAAEVGMGYETFRKRFRQELGIGPSAYRSARRLEAARALLTSTAMSHREIAASLGFRDEFHFSKRFKQWSGVPPREIRRAARSLPPGALRGRSPDRDARPRGAR